MSKENTNVVEDDKSLDLTRKSETPIFSFELPAVSDTDESFNASQSSTDSITLEDDETSALNTETDETGEIPNADETSEADKVRGTLSSKSDSFDPSIHHFPPSETKTGKWRKKSKKRGADESEVIQPNIVYRAIAQDAAMVYANGHIPILGMDAGINNKDELLPLIDSIEAYYNANPDAIKPSPGLLVAMSAVNYSYSVTQREKVQPRVRTLLQTGKEKARLVWGKITGKEVKEDTPVKETN